VSRRRATLWLVGSRPIRPGCDVKQAQVQGQRVPADNCDLVTQRGMLGVEQVVYLVRNDDGRDSKYRRSVAASPEITETTSRVKIRHPCRFLDLQTIWDLDNENNQITGIYSGVHPVFQNRQGAAGTGVHNMRPPWNSNVHRKVQLPCRPNRGIWPDTLGRLASIRKLRTESGGVSSSPL